MRRFMPRTAKIFLATHPFHPAHSWLLMSAKYTHHSRVYPVRLTFPNIAKSWGNGVNPSINKPVFKVETKFVKEPDYKTRINSTVHKHALTQKETYSEVNRERFKAYQALHSCWNKRFMKCRQADTQWKQATLGEGDENHLHNHQNKKKRKFPQLSEDCRASIETACLYLFSHISNSKMCFPGYLTRVCVCVCVRARVCECVMLSLTADIVCVCDSKSDVDGTIQIRTRAVRSNFFDGW